MLVSSSPSSTRGSVSPLGLYSIDIESLSHITLHSVRRGSPLLVGIKAEGLESDSIPVQYSQEDHPKTYAHIPADLDPTSSPLIPRKKTSAMFRVDSDHVSIMLPLYLPMPKKHLLIPRLRRSTPPMETQSSISLQATPPPSSSTLTG